MHVLAAERSAPKMNTILLIKNATRSACYLLIASRNSSEVYFALFIITPAPSAGRQAVRVNFEWHFWEIAYRSRTFSTRWAAGELRVSARVFHALAVKSAQGAREKKNYDDDDADTDMTPTGDYVKYQRSSIRKEKTAAFDDGLIPKCVASRPETSDIRKERNKWREINMFYSHIFLFFW